MSPPNRMQIYDIVEYKQNDEIIGFDFNLSFHLERMDKNHFVLNINDRIFNITSETPIQISEM